MKNLFILALVSLVHISLSAQTLEWAKKIGTTSNDRVYSITTDASGNVYTTGYFQNTVDFDPGTGLFNLTSSGGYDIFVSKLDPSGNLVWAKNMGGSANDVGESITLDFLGNIYITGYFQGTVNMDPGSNTYNLTSSGSYDIFITKLNAAGNFVWAKQMGGSGVDIGYAISTDTIGNVYSTGYFRSTADFNPGAGTFNLISEGIRDIFISKLDSSGNFVWAKQMGGTGYDNGTAMNIDSFGNLLVTGVFQDTVDFDPGTGIVNLISGGLFDIFICKFDTSGSLLWAKGMGGTNTDQSVSLITDSVGNVYTTGSFYNTVDFDPNIGIFNLTSAGSKDVFILKLNSSGAFVWVKRIGGTGEDIGFGISNDSLGNLYTTGMFENTVDFNPGSGTNNLTSNGDGDCFINKLDASGNFIWALYSGGTDDDVGYGISIDNSNNIYTAGIFENTVDFDPSSTSFNLTSAGAMDVFIQKLSQCPSVSSTDTITACNSYTWINGNTYTQSTNTPTFTFSGGAASGCDSVITLNLTINNNTTGIDTITACSSYTWIDGVTYTSSTNIPTFTFTGTASNSCDSIATLHLTINNSTNGIDTIVACGSYTWIDGITYTASTNTPTHNLVDSANNGCDSLVTLHLTINNSTIGSDTIIACGSYTWIDGITYTGSTTTPTYNLVGAADNGCDSLVTLHLTINYSTNSVDSITACDSYTWIDGVTYTSNNSTASFTLINSTGCDSLITLMLIINEVNTSVTQNGNVLTADQLGAVYQWVTCPSMSSILGATNQSYSALTNGDYAVTISYNGCSDTSECYNVNSTGILENSFGNSLLLYPNPTVGNFSIDMGKIYPDIQVDIMDLYGKVIQTENFSQRQLLRLKLQEKSTGVYLVLIKSGDQRALIRLMKK